MIKILIKEQKRIPISNSDTRIIPLIQRQNSSEEDNTQPQTVIPNQIKILRNILQTNYNSTTYLKKLITYQQYETIIARESGFNHLVKNKDGLARGLFQIRPDLAKAMKWKNYTSTWMFSEASAEYGTVYLENLSKKIIANAGIFEKFKPNYLALLHLCYRLPSDIAGHMMKLEKNDQSGKRNIPAQYKSELNWISSNNLPTL